MSLALSRAQPNKATARNIPAFLNKLYAMVQDPNTNDLIRWSNDGDSFLVPSPDRFGRELLPRFFKHSNFGSFVRQLNMYGFHKVPHLQHGVLKNDYEEQNELLEFSNPNFTREQPDLLCLIRRQKARADTAVSSESALDLPSLLTDLAAIRKHQTALSADLKDLETSNRALWEEAIQSRERHTRHQETINKILRFLATVFGGQVGGAENESPREARAEDVGSDLKGKGKETDRVPMPAVRSRLLLEDVKERRDARARERQIEEEVDEDDMIEEIGLQDNAMNAGSSSSRYPPKPPLPRSPASTGFTSSLGNTNATNDAPYQLPPDVLSSLLSPSNSNNLAAFMQLQNGAPLSPPIPALYNSNNLLLNSTTPSTQQHVLASLLPTLPVAVPEDYSQAIHDHAEVLQEVQNEKADIDGRTTALEVAIAKLMQGLPVETRDALGSGGDAALGGVGGSQGTGAGLGEGLDWDPAVGGAPTSDIDLDNFLAQYSNQESADYSYLFDPASPVAPLLPNALPAYPSLPEVITPLSSSTPMADYQVRSPSLGSSSVGSMGGDDLGGEDVDWIGPGSARTGKRRKRKSDVLIENVAEGSRKSTRQRRSSGRGEVEEEEEEE